MVSADRSARVFLSSTFRDFGDERDLLVRRVFPSLRARLKNRYVELVDVDLRWGITAEQAERGEVLPICLAEIDRARPFFVGMLGERYGWVPTADRYAADLLERQRWLEEHRGGRSVTELEILHGVLNNPAMAGRAFFYFRSPAYAKAKGGDFIAVSAEDAARQSDLKDRIRACGFPIFENYATPEAFAQQLEQDLWRVLDEAFPADQAPDAFAREAQRHEAYAAPRRRLYLGGGGYVASLKRWLREGTQRVLIEGQSGGGKSALLANWLAQHAVEEERDLIHAHYIGASEDAADPHSLVRRLCEGIKRQTRSREEIASDRQSLMESLPSWLAIAGAYAAKEDRRWVMVIDGLNGLRGQRDLRWWPEFLPERVHVVVSCLPGDVMEALEGKGSWRRLRVEPLDAEARRVLLRRYLARYNKVLSAELEEQALSHSLANNPLFLRTLCEELRVFGVHEQLAERLRYCLTSTTIDDLFEKVLERVETDCGAAAVRGAMEGIWASRAGLTEGEILGLVGLVPATWAPIHFALDDALLESGGRLSFAHDYLRQAVADRYLSQRRDGRAAHARLGAWFEGQPVDARTTEEVPYQWHAARAWDRLKTSLTRREMFEAVYETRPNEEILSYWLALEGEAGADLDRDYEAAWGAWRLDKAAEETAELANKLGAFLSFAGRHKDFTLRLAQLALTIAEKSKGPEHPDTGICLDCLAVLLQQQGDYAAAEPLYRRALAIAEKAQGPEHPSTGTSLNNLALLLQDQGDYAAAEPLYRRALVIAEKAQGPEHPDTGTLLNNLAGLLKDQGDYTAAEPLYRRALTIAEKSKGAEHPSTGASLNNLALLLQDQGDYAAAEPLYRRALAIAEKAQGPEHPRTGSSLNNLAGLLKDQGDYTAAEPLYRRALTIAEKSKGPEHPSTGTSLNNLALLLQDQGDYGAAEPLYRRALTIAEKAQGPEHPETGTLLNNLAGLLKDQGEYTAAEPLYRRALAIAEKARGPEHPSTGTSLNNLAALLKDQGDYAAAEPLYRRALAIIEKANGPEHPSTGTSLNNLAVLLQQQGDYAAAEPLYRRALAIAEKAQGPEHPETGTSLNNLALLLQDQGDYAAAEPLYRRALKIAEKAQGPEHPETGTLLNNLAGLLKEQGEYTAAEPLYQRALTIAEKAQGAEHSEVATILYSLGQVLGNLHRNDEAEQCFFRELAIVEKIEGVGSDSVRLSLQNLGVMLRDVGKSQEAEAALQRAHRLAEDLHGTDSDEVASALSALGRLWQMEARLDDAAQALKRSLEIRMSLFGPADSRTEATQKRLDELRQRNQQPNATTP
jgi:tetratricopeptide (TPR) repeat protein